MQYLCGVLIGMLHGSLSEAYCSVLIH